MSWTNQKRRDVVVLRVIVGVFVGLGITAVQMVLSTFVQSQAVNWALPGSLIVQVAYHRYHAPGIILLALAILTNTFAYAVAVLLLLGLMGRARHE